MLHQSPKSGETFLESFSSLKKKKFYFWLPCKEFSPHLHHFYQLHHCLITSQSQKTEHNFLSSHNLLLLCMHQLFYFLGGLTSLQDLKKVRLNKLALSFLFWVGWRDCSRVLRPPRVPAEGRKAQHTYNETAVWNRVFNLRLVKLITKRLIKRGHSFPQK